jgi:hypothetical protein
MKRHVHRWVPAEKGWGECTFELTSGPNKGGYCLRPAVVGCFGRRRVMPGGARFSCLDGLCRRHAGRDPGARRRLPR